MSLGQLSSRGKQNNKLYMIQCKTKVNSKTFTFYFYSTKIISNETDLIKYLRLRNNTQSIGVFGNNYVVGNDSFIVLSEIKADPTNDTFYLYYYKNDGAGWRMNTISTISFKHFEM